MLAFIGVIHILMALILIVLVLLQDSKGGAMGMLSGGGNTVFGSTGAVNFLVKATRTVAIVFAATSITLAYMTAQKDDSVLDKVDPVATEAAPESAVTPVETAPAEKASGDTTAPQEQAK